jgi:threonine dehydrogenase-like Zn-dependent dehydrogenase
MSAFQAPATMRAVVYKGPYEVAVEDKPYPQLQNDTDCVLKVTTSALCGSDLHFYRGQLKTPAGFVCGHEFVGEIVEKGAKVERFGLGEKVSFLLVFLTSCHSSIGGFSNTSFESALPKSCVIDQADSLHPHKVVVPFYTACGTCFYCSRGQASRCAQGQLFGNALSADSIDGGQAEYVRVPLCDTTCVRAPTNIPEEMLVLMADIFPTGYFAASRFLKNLDARDRKEFTSVVVGCGPVGLCAIACAVTMVDTVYAIDSVPERLQEAAALGAIPIHLTEQDPVAEIKKATDGRGADVVMEVVGHGDALQLSLDLIRPWGSISSVGMHNHALGFEGFQLYSKNATLAFGRCPVRSIFEGALELLVKQQDKVKWLCGKTMSLEDAPQAYKDFEARKVHKVLFKAPGT